MCLGSSSQLKIAFVCNLSLGYERGLFFSIPFRMKFSILVYCDIKMFLPQFFRLFGIIFCSKNHWTSRGHRCSQKWTGYIRLQSRGGSNADYNLVQRWGIGCNRSHRQISKFLGSFYYIPYAQHYSLLLNISHKYTVNWNGISANRIAISQTTILGQKTCLFLSEKLIGRKNAKNRKSL